MPAPRVIGPYEIVELLGRGGMGEVYKAFDTRMYRRPVALKLISEALGADPRALYRFDLEIETAANLRHPNIVQIYDRGEYEGRRYFAMEFLEGQDLGSVILERAARSLDARVEIILQLCDALDYAHTREKVVVHRDIKPANVMVTTRGGTDHVKLLDFGIAHVARSDHTRTVVQPGTTLYMSPEQLKDEPVTPRSDLFSVGIVAFELIAGVHPFKGRTDYLTSSNIMFEKQPPLRSLEPAAPEELELLVDGLLEKHADSRIASAAEVATGLRKIVRQLRSGPSELDPPSFGNVDEMTTLMVERIVHFAKSKERAGVPLEALEAYKRALLLAPGAPWLQAQVTRIERELSAAPPIGVARDETTVGDHTSSRNRHREAFVVEKLVEAGAALDDGDLDTASSIVAAVLRRYPDDSRALVLMDRIVLITDRGVDVKPYRQAIRAAREALAHGDVSAARRSCAAAVAIWPDDDEVISLDREIEGVRQVELSAAVAACDDVLARAATGAVTDEAVTPEVARAREALRRAGEMGAAPSLVEEKTRALARIEADVRARADERARKAREAEGARVAEVERLLGDARRALEDGVGAVDASSAHSALPRVRAAAESVARAEALGADRGETQELASRLSSAAQELTKKIALDAEQEREARARLDAVRTGFAEVESLLTGPASGLPRADELLRGHRSQLQAIESARPAVGGLPELRAMAADLSRRVAELRRIEDERTAKEARDRQQREDAERLERERQGEEQQHVRLAEEKREAGERAKAAAKAERLEALLADARAAYREADDLAGSIDTEADRMGTPLAEARRAVDEMLKVDAGDEEAKALLKRIERLQKQADGHAAAAGRRREEAAQRERDEELRRQEARRAARRRWLMLGGVAVVAIGLMVGGWFAYSQWSQGKARAAQAERDRIEAAAEKRHEQDKAQAATTLSEAGGELTRLRSGMVGIATEQERSHALSACDALIEKINGAGILDPANSDVARLTTTAADLRIELQGVDVKEAVAPPPVISTGHEDAALKATLKSIREDLKLAGDAPRGPIAEVDRGLQRADHGIELAKGVLASDPGHAETTAFLGQLQSTRKTLLRWQQELAAEDTKSNDRRKTELTAATTLLDKAEAAVKAGRDPAPALADCNQVARTIDGILRGDPGQRDALSLRARNDKVRADLNKIKDAKKSDVVPPPDKPPEPPPEPKIAALDPTAVEGLFRAFKSALVARDQDAIQRVYPSYPSLALLSKLKQFEYDFVVVKVDEGQNLAVIRQTTRQRQALGYWDPPQTATLQYVLARHPDGSWYIQSGRIAPK